ncbi:MAG: hypothetical protein ACREUV_04760 [Burkholderiales bacterium]
MKAQTISIKVDSELAKAYQNAPSGEKKKIEILVNFWLKEFASDKMPLKK